MSSLQNTGLAHNISPEIQKNLADSNEELQRNLRELKQEMREKDATLAAQAKKLGEKDKQIAFLKEDTSSVISEEEDDDHHIILLANIEGCQHTNSKTQKEIDFITLMDSAVRTHVAYNVSASRVHNITILITSRNLAETGQWKLRLDKELGNDDELMEEKYDYTESDSDSEDDKRTLNICTITNKSKNDGKGSGNKVDALITALDLRDKDELPDVVTICSHYIRIADCVTLLEHAAKGTRMQDGFKIAYNFVFDECDESNNLSHIRKVLRTLVDRPDLKKRVKMIRFITGTLGKKFWRMLKASGLGEELTNIDHALDLDTREEADAEWRSIKEQPHTPFESSSDPVDYVKEVFDASHINLDAVNIVMAPGATAVASHEAIANYFNELGWWTFVHNGQEKGFRAPDGTKISIRDFNKLHNIKGELRETLAKWKSMYPEVSLGLTGYSTIKRGITFNTTGFNFTHMIVSVNHGNHTNELVQLFGRAQGNRRYCGEIQIISPLEVYTRTTNYIDRLKTIKLQNAEKYSEDDFTTQKEEEKYLFFKFSSQDKYFSGNAVWKSVILPKLDRSFYTGTPRGPRRCRQDSEDHYKEGKWCFSYGHEAARRRWKPRTRRDIMETLTSVVRGVGRWGWVPCYATEEYDDSSLQWWLVMKEHSFMADCILELKILEAKMEEALESSDDEDSEEKKSED